jgi:hypothetical protein
MIIARLQGFVVVVTARYCGIDRLKRVLTSQVSACQCCAGTAILASTHASAGAAGVGAQPGPPSAGSARDLRCQQHW